MSQEEKIRTLTEAAQSKSLLPGEVLVVKNDLTYLAYSPTEKGGILFTFSEISFSKQSAICVLEISLIGGGYKQSFSQKIDLRSASARTNLARDLKASYEERINWVLTLNTAFTKIMGAVRDERKPVSVVDVVYEEIPFVLLPFLQENVSNLLFAQSEAGKTWFALRMALSMAAGGTFLNYPVTGGKKTLFLDYEDDIRTFTNRLHKLCKGANLDFKQVAPYIQYFKPTGSFRDNTELIKDIVSQGRYSLIIIDAGGDATGGSPSDEEKVLDLFNALEEVKVTKLILHHEPKNVQNESAAFYGSMYWKARSRVAWRLEVENQEGGEKLIKATIQKRSNLPYIEPIYYKTYFDGVDIDEALRGDAVPAVRIELVSQNQLNRVRPLDEISVETLEKHGEMSVLNLQDVLGRERSVVFKKLKEMEAKGLVEQVKRGRTFLWRLKH